MNTIEKIKGLDNKTKTLLIILIILVIAAIAIVIVNALNKSEEVVSDQIIADVTEENIELEYNTEPTTEAIAIDVKNYDSNYNLYYYIQNLEELQTVDGEETTQTSEEEQIAQQEETTTEQETEQANAETTEVTEENEETQEVISYNMPQIEDSQYKLYEGNLEVAENAIVFFKYEKEGSFSQNAYKLEITNIIGGEQEGATEEELEEEKVNPEEEDNSAKYYIKVNYKANTVTIYTKDANNEYTVPVKAMVCSTGTATPTSGVYKTTNKYVWRQLNGGVYGQYATRIVGSILFHSVPYTAPKHDALKYASYDKLGIKASAGCIRLTVADAKWIYDNCGSGTMVEFYASSNPGPLGKPSAQKISSVVECRNYDPTDPVAGNPWRTYKGSTQTTEQAQPATPAPAPTQPTTPSTEPTTPQEPQKPAGNPELANTKYYEKDTETINKVIEILRAEIAKNEELTGATVVSCTKEQAQAAGATSFAYSESAVKNKVGTAKNYYVYVEKEYTYNETGTNATLTKTSVYIYTN